MLVHAKIQKWGNGLALRISKSMRDIPLLEAGMLVDVEVDEEGFTVKKSRQLKLHKLPYSEQELLDDLLITTDQVDLLAIPLSKEWE